MFSIILGKLIFLVSMINFHYNQFHGNEVPLIGLMLDDLDTSSSLHRVVKSTEVRLSELELGFPYLKIFLLNLTVSPL